MKINSRLTLTVALAAVCLSAAAQTSEESTAVAPSAPPAADTSAAAGSPANEVMPLIVIEDAALPDAIKHLARMASLNIQFDPKVIAGTVDAKGVPTPPPQVSFRWENVTPLQALYAVLDNYGLQLVQDPRSKIFRVTTKDPQALEPLLPRVVTLKYTQPTNVMPVIKATFSTPRSQVLADARTGQLLVLATEGELEKIDDILSRLDVPPQQVLIEARFIETTRNPESLKGINWQNTLERQRFWGGNVSTPSGFVPDPESTIPRVIATTADGLGPIGILNVDGVNAVLSWFNRDAQSEVIATPRAVALEGVPTELAVVRNIPVLEEEQGGMGAGLQAPTSIKIRYEVKVEGRVINEVGVKLVVTPRIFGGSNVFLKLDPEISQQGEDVRQLLSGRFSTAPTFERRRISTEAMVPSGNTLVLGGLGQDANSREKTKVPGLGDIPGLGQAFRSTAKRRTKSDLLIFVTPTILVAEDYNAAPEARDFLKQKPVDKPEVKWAPIDSAEPKDWTRP